MEVCAATKHDRLELDVSHGQRVTAGYRHPQTVDARQSLCKNGEMLLLAAQNTATMAGAVTVNRSSK